MCKWSVLFRALCAKRNCAADPLCGLMACRRCPARCGPSDVRGAGPPPPSYNVILVALVAMLWPSPSLVFVAYGA